MLPRSPVFVAGTLLALLANACGDTSRNTQSSDTSDMGSTATGSGGSATEGTTSTATTSVTNGTGGTPSNVCPSFEPAVSSACAADGQVCVFENCQAPDYRDSHALTCSSGAWTLTDATACAIDCPVEIDRRVGHWCDELAPPGPCTGLDACAQTREVMCINAVWQTTDDKVPDEPDTTTGAGTGGFDEAPLCPSIPPYLGDPCCPEWVPVRCDYSDTGTAGAAGASFLIDPTTGAGFDAPVTLDCAVCSDELTWTYCPVAE